MRFVILNLDHPCQGGQRDLAFAKADAEHFGIRMKETSWRQLDSRRADQTSGGE
jgi:hypothetical protein